MNRTNSRGTTATWVALVLPVVLAGMAVAADLGAYTYQRTEILKAAKNAARASAAGASERDPVAAARTVLDQRLDPTFTRQARLVDLDGTQAISLRVERPFDAPAGVLPFPEHIAVAVTLPLMDRYMTPP